MSATDLIDLSNSDHAEVITSLDVESLFTNIPVNRTIEYILKEIYPDNDVPKIDLPKKSASWKFLSSAPRSLQYRVQTIDLCQIFQRYFVKTDKEETVALFIRKLQENFGLNFTTEGNQDNKLIFLDVLVQQSPNSFKAIVYTKPSNLGLCLSGKSECPQRYKDSIVGAYIRRALTHSSDWDTTHLEIERVTQKIV
ncbi:uncharacterized protein LOC143034770 [Oratosquilla oratoria]|uniref:uncharacterized protein LOC143034770 n=1 Tax=Oratosquilla oratoria TaxID=337810 RepID=UPI003F77436E